MLRAPAVYPEAAKCQRKASLTLVFAGVGGLDHQMVYSRPLAEALPFQAGWLPSAADRSRRRSNRYRRL